MRNLFYLLAVFISFSLVRAVAAAAVAADFCCCCCAPPPHLAPLFGGGKYQKKTPVASAMAVVHVGVCVGVVKVAVWCKNHMSEI